MSLISYWEDVVSESPEACADRWRVAYGLERAMSLADVMVKFASGRPIAAYHRKVGEVLCQFSAPVQQRKSISLAPTISEKYAKHAASKVKAKRARAR